MAKAKSTSQSDGKNKLGVKNSLVNNINARKKKGKSRPKKKSTVSKKSYDDMQHNWDKGTKAEKKSTAKKRTAKKSSAKKSSKSSAYATAKKVVRKKGAKTKKAAKKRTVKKSAASKKS